MSGWGLSPWGISGWGVPGFGDGLQLLLAEAIRDNLVRLFFNRAVLFTRLENPGDGSVIDKYNIQVVAGTIGEDGLNVRPVFPALVQLGLEEGAAGREIDLIVDRSFSPYPAQYVVSVNGLKAQTGELLDPGFTMQHFYGLAEFEPPPIPGEILIGNDIANPQTREAVGDGVALTEVTALGSYPIDETGDYSFDKGLVSYRKRIFRRLTTRRGAFAHLPDYGVGVNDQIKRLARPGVREALAAEAESQIRLEPETATVSVQILQDPNLPSLTRFIVKATTKAGDVVNVNVPISVG